MADKNKVSDRKIQKPNKISTTQLYDMTGGYDLPMTVTITNQRTVTNSGERPYLKRMQSTAKNSPWRDDRLGKSFNDRSLQSEQNENPTEALMNFLRALEKL